MSGGDIKSQFQVMQRLVYHTANTCLNKHWEEMCFIIQGIFRFRFLLRHMELSFRKFRWWNALAEFFTNIAFK